MASDASHVTKVLINHNSFGHVLFFSPDEISKIRGAIENWVNAVDYLTNYSTLVFQSVHIDKKKCTKTNRQFKLNFNVILCN